MKFPRLLGWIATIGVFAFFIFGVLVPLGALLSRSGGWRTFSDPDVLAIVRATVWQALGSVLFSSLVGLPLGLWIGARPNRFTMTFLALPYGVPTVVAGSAWILWLGRSGVFGSLDLAYSFKALIIAHVFFNAPLIALLVAQARSAIPRYQIESAKTLGAGFFDLFSAIIWPHVRWAFASAAAQVMALCSMSFALVLILGGGPPVETLETALYERVRYGTLDVSGAAACAIWELLVTLSPWVLVLLLRGQAHLEQAGESRGSWRKESWDQKLLLPLIAAFFTLPYLAIYAGGTLKVLFSPQFMSELMGPLWISVELALFTSIGAIVFTLLGLITLSFHGNRPTSQIVSLILTLPSGISVLVLGLGAWLAYGKWVDPFSGSLTAMILLQVVIFSPFAYRILWPVAQASQDRLLDAASVLGASPVQAFFTVEWPRWRLPIFRALAIIAGASLGEVAAVSLFYSENLVPLPLLISRWMSQYRFDEAQAVAALLLSLSMLLIALISFGGTDHERLAKA